MIKRVGKSPEGFQAWADLNGYIVITPYDNQDGIGVAYKKDDTNRTPIDFQWKVDTFQP